ncbi:MAG TPA: lipopeptide [Coxiellaceae bacterium]|nr:lipopeptide [Coxiellaceae bacterium]HBS51565.1 lipopeptide [Coxiellaceae bacterium]HBY56119.1 lipopeptide [Coxiellaceae bacterium]
MLFFPIFCILLSIAGCGQTGPLYLPASEQQDTNSSDNK